MAFDVDRLMVYMIEASREIPNKAKFTILRDARGICNLARGAAYTVNTYFVPDGWTEKELAYYIVTVYDFFMYYTHGVNDKGKIFIRYAAWDKKWDDNVSDDMSHHVDDKWRIYTDETINKINDYIEKRKQKLVSQVG
jgi:hypothetical protein